MSGAAPTPDPLLDALRAFGDVVLELSADGRFTHVGGEEGRSWFRRDRFLGRTPAQALPAEVAKPLAAAAAAVSADGVPRSVELAIGPAGERRHYEARIARVASGRVVVLARDVHEKKDAEERLRESETRFRLMADSAPVLLWMAGTDSRCDFFNRGWLQFTGRPIEAEMGEGWASGVHPEDFQGCMDVYLSAFVERRPFRMEYRLRRADGAYRWILDQGAPRFSPDGRFEGYIGSCVDVTDLRDAREVVARVNVELEERVRVRTGELAAALAEREVLLREIHHRVKNNLQLISSLLSLQASGLEGPARDLISEGQRRVRSIALVHEKLYESKDLSEVDFRRYLHDLVAVAAMAAGASARVQVLVDAEPLRLPVDQAVPCGLAVNELLTNALKHGFPGARAGTVRVEARRRGGEVHVAVRDDGAGVPAGFDPRGTSSLGMTLVVALTEQLEGRLEVEGGRGSTFRIAFPLATRPVPTPAA